MFTSLHFDGIEVTGFEAGTALDAFFFIDTVDFFEFTANGFAGTDLFAG
jgi:hypothetical protein